MQLFDNVMMLPVFLTNFVFVILNLKIYNYQGVVSEDYNVANTPAPPGKLIIYLKSGVAVCWLVILGLIFVFHVIFISSRCHGQSK